jgi:hypothetical protein
VGLIGKALPLGFLGACEQAASVMMSRVRIRGFMGSSNKKSLLGSRLVHVKS